MKFSQKMPLYFFHTMMQKVKNDQKLKSRGSALIIIIIKWGLFIKMATDWQVSEVGDTCRPAVGPRSVQIEWISAGTAHLGFPALWSVPHLLSREIKMNRRHSLLFHERQFDFSFRSLCFGQRPVRTLVTRSAFLPSANIVKLQLASEHISIFFADFFCNEKKNDIA